MIEAIVQFLLTLLFLALAIFLAAKTWHQDK